MGIQELSRRDECAFGLVTMADTVANLLAQDSGCSVVLLDLRLGDNSRPRDNVRTLIEAGYSVLIFTDGARLSWVAEALASGAAGLVLKSEAPATLEDAILAVSRGDSWVSAEVAEVLVSSSNLRPHLTQREVQVLELLNRGLAAKQVARELGLAVATVNEHLKRIRSKYSELGRDAGNRVALLQRAEEDLYLDGSRLP